MSEARSGADTPELAGESFAGYVFVHRMLDSLTADGMRVLELGSGAGYYGRSVHGWYVPTDVTTDPYPYRGGRRRLVRVVCTAEALPFAAASFDFAFSIAVMHIVADHEAAAAELRRILRPGGRALTLTYPERTLRRVQVGGARQASSPGELAQVFVRHGFTTRFVDTDEPRSGLKRAALRIPPIHTWRRTHSTWVALLATVAR